MTVTDAERITQQNADRRFNTTGQAGSTFLVSLPGVAAAKLVAFDRDEAIARYNDLCGITKIFGVQHHVELLDEYPAPMPTEG